MSGLAQGHACVMNDENVDNYVISNVCSYTTVSEIIFSYLDITFHNGHCPMMHIATNRDVIARM